MMDYDGSTLKPIFTNKQNKAAHKSKKKISI